MFFQIAFRGNLEQSKGDTNKWVCCWRPLVKGAYRMYIKDVYVNGSEENIGVIAG